MGKKKENKEKTIRKKISSQKEEIKEKPVIPKTGSKKAEEPKKTPTKKMTPTRRTSPAKPSAKKKGKTAGAPGKTRLPETKSISTQETTPPLPDIMNVESSKYEMKPPGYKRESKITPPGTPHDLPMYYGDTKVVILVRDPEWIFAYWEINDNSRIKHDLIRGRHDKTLALRIFDITGVKFDGTNANRSYDVIINDYAVSWYLRMPEVNRSWCVDLGYYDTHSGNFITLARSNIVKTPSGSISPKEDDKWMQINEEQYKEILRLSGGLDIKDFGGSENLLRIIAEKIKHQVERSSGASGRISSGQTKKKGNK